MSESNEQAKARMYDNLHARCEVLKRTVKSLEQVIELKDAIIDLTTKERDLERLRVDKLTRECEVTTDDAMRNIARAESAESRARRAEDALREAEEDVEDIAEFGCSNPGGPEACAANHISRCVVCRARHALPKIRAALAGQEPRTIAEIVAEKRADPEFDAAYREAVQRLEAPTTRPAQETTHDASTCGGPETCTHCAVAAVRTRVRQD